MRNIELKARLADFGAARRTAELIGAKRLDPQHQIDTYFHCREGRLKLRQIAHRPAQLIWYARDDRSEAKASDYLLVPVSNPETLKAALAAAQGIAVVVEKHREIFLWHNVRIHLDRITGLGEFLEFEAVLGAKVDDTIGHGQLDELRGQFAIEEADLLSRSYSDMLLDESGNPSTD